MARFQMKKFGLVLKDAQGMRNYRDNYDATFGKQNELAPGSTAALQAGCKCPIEQNDYGHGDPDGVFIIDESCPIHG